MTQNQTTSVKRGEQALIYHQQTQAPEEISDCLREIAEMIEEGEVRLGEETFDCRRNYHWLKLFLFLIHVALSGRIRATIYFASNFIINRNDVKFQFNCA